MCILAAINADLNRRLDEKNHQSDETTPVPKTTDAPITTTEVEKVTTTESAATTTSLKDEGTQNQSNVHGRRRRFA